MEAAEAEVRKQAQVVAEAEAMAAALQQALMEATTAGARQRAEAAEAAESEARQQAQVITEVKAKAAALQQAWMEAATAEARQQAEEAAAASRQQTEADAAVAIATAGQQRIAEHTRARSELTAKVIRLLIGDHDVDIRRLSARIHPRLGGVFLHNYHATNPPALTTPKPCGRYCAGTFILSDSLGRRRARCAKVGV